MALLNHISACDLKKERIHVEDPLAIEKIAQTIVKILQLRNINEANKIILMCIGTDRSTGDCLGPLVGSKLTCDQDFFQVYGTLDQPVHAGNLQEYMEEIQSKYNQPFIIALDACLGNMDSVGCITIGEGSLQPGAGVNKSLPRVGDMHITGIVNVGGFMEYLVLQNTRLNLVMKIANTIVGGLSRTALSFQQNIARSI